MKKKYVCRTCDIGFGNPWGLSEHRKETGHDSDIVQKNKKSNTKKKLAKPKKISLQPQANLIKYCPQCGFHIEGVVLVQL